MKSKSLLSVITALPLTLLFASPRASADAVESELYVHSSRTHGYDAVSGRAVSVPATHRPSATAPREPRATTPNREPRRIYNLETGQYDINPDYREPHVAPAALNSRRGVEPRRIFDLEADNFVLNPAYREPAPVAAAPRTGEPRRMYDLEKGRFVDNPDYHESTLMANTVPTGTQIRQSRGGSGAMIAQNATHRDSGKVRQVARRVAQRHHSAPDTAPKSIPAAS